MPNPGGNPPVALDYAAAPSRWRRRIGLVATSLVIGVATFAGWRWGPAAWNRARCLYAQRQCLAYVAGPEQVVYEGNPNLAKLLLSQQGYVVPQTLHDGMNGT